MDSNVWSIDERAVPRTRMSSTIIARSGMVKPNSVEYLKMINISFKWVVGLRWRGVEQWRYGGGLGWKALPVIIDDKSLYPTSLIRGRGHLCKNAFSKSPWAQPSETWKTIIYQKIHWQRTAWLSLQYYLIVIITIRTSRSSAEHIRAQSVPS
jgi:hypothetical protein